MSVLTYLPNPGLWPTTPVTPRETLNASAKGDVQISVAAENAPLRIMYGQVRVGPQIATVLSYQGDLVIHAVWGHGEVDSFLDLQIDDKAVESGVTYTHYTGTTGQGVDPLMVLAFAAQSVPRVYTDALPGICYSVVRVPMAASTGFPRMNALIKGRKVWTGAVYEWTDNPAYCIADFITNEIYGMAKTVNWDSVVSVAADCDVLAGIAPVQEKLRTINLVIDTVQPVKQWLETLSTYACCWTPQSGPDIKLISDKVRDVVADFSHAGGNILTMSNPKKRGVQSMPTVMTVTYTDTSTTPYRDGTAVVYAAGVLSGDTPRRESQVSLPGINRYSQAYREATERLNKLLFNDLSFELGVFDEGLKLEMGDVITVTHPIGLSEKQMQIMGCSGEYGRYNLTTTEYDPIVYSSSVATAPTWADTNLPSPTAPPAISGLSLSEEVYQLKDGTFSSRIVATWTPATYSFLKHYRVEVRKTTGLALVDSSSVDQSTSPSYSSPAVQEGENYTVLIQSVSSIGAGGTWASTTITALGKTLIPGDVPSLGGFEVGGEVRLSWPPAVDIDIWKYEVRYGLVAGTWGDGTLIDRFDALRCITKDVPVGTWDFMVKAVDSVGQYSTTEARLTITVTSDLSSFLVDDYDFNSPALVYTTAYQLGRTDASVRYVSDDGIAFGTKFGSFIGTYANLLQTAQASEWEDHQDFGLTLSGNWTAESDAVAGVGSISQVLELSPDGSTWTNYSALVAKATQRWAGIKVNAAAGSAFLLSTPGMLVRIDAIPREESSGDTVYTSISTGPKTVYLENDYSAVQSITITPTGTTSASSTVDNIGHNAPNAADKAATITVTGSVITNSSASVWRSVRGLHAIPAGKWYWETKIDAGGVGDQMFIGLANSSAAVAATYIGSDVNGWAYYGNTGQSYHSASPTALGASYTTGNVIGIAFDTVAGTVQFFKNGVSQGTVSSVTGSLFPAWSEYVSGSSMTARFRSHEWSYTPPTNYEALPFAFDTHIFNDAGTRIARDFRWNFKGV